MRISDWSSDVCSSDLLFRGRARHPRHGDDDLPDAPHGPEGAQGIEPVHRLHLFDPEGFARMVDRASRQEWHSDGQAGRALRSALRRFRSEEHTSELQSLMRISYAVFCLKKKKCKNK